MKKDYIKCGDCLDLMRGIPDNSIDMILCDLPYGVTQNKWDSVIPLEKLWSQYKRIVKSNGIIALFGSQPFSSMLVSSNYEMYRHEWIWIKNRGSNFANTMREPMKEHESIFVFSRGKWTYNPQMQGRAESGANRVKYSFNNTTTSENYNKFTRPPSEASELRVPSSYQKFNTEVGLHPTQKPVALCEYLIRTYTNVGDVVLDNCMGSGTTCVAALNTDRHYIGFELEEKYFNIAKRRIDKTKAEGKQLALEGVW